MGKIGEKNKICLAAAVSVSMFFSATAMAAPMDELNAVLERQQAAGWGSLMAEELGFEELVKEFAENGMQIQVKAGLTAATFETPGLAGAIPDDVYGTLNLQIDQNLQKWLFEAGFGMGEAALLDAELYGDLNLLALSIPQLYSGAVGIGGGSFLEQYNGSVISQYAGTELPIPDYNLKFFPEEGDFALSGPAAELQMKLEQKTQEIEADAQVDKVEEAGQTRYTLHVATESILETYDIVLDTYMSLFQNAELVSSAETEQVRAELDTMLDQTMSVLGDEIAVNFYVKDDLLTKIDYEMVIDTTEMEEAIAQEAAALETDAYADDTAVDSETDYEVNPFVGNLIYEYTFENPEIPMQAFNLKMQVKEQESGQSIMLKVEKQTTVTDSVSRTTIDMDLWESGETVYSGTLFDSYYDSATGDFDANVTFNDGTSAIVLHLDSVISAMENGFVWTIDALELQADGQSAGICAEITVSSNPGEIITPENPRMIFALDEGGLMGLLTEVSINAENWAAALAGDMGEAYSEEVEIAENNSYEEIVIEDGSAADVGTGDDGYIDIVVEEAHENNAEYEDIVVEEAPVDEASSVAMIGGADGPTSIFVAGKVG